MAILSALIGFAILVFGLLKLTKLTLGVGLICIACFFGILARILQARAQHEKQIEKLNEIKKQSSDMSEGITLTLKGIVPKLLAEVDKNTK